MMKTSKRVVLGITSGIAAYKMLDFIRLLKKEAIEVDVVMTASSVRMLDPKEVENVIGKRAYIDLFEDGFDYKSVLVKRKVDHIDLADRADVIVIAPATANVVAKLAHGIADDFLTTMVLAATSPIILSPSMNVHMWHNPVTQKNIASLEKRGFIIIPPESGPLACGYEGLGRLPHLEKIKEETMRQIAYTQSFRGKKIVVTAGGTVEEIDDARVITNRSSGKMGVAIAEECHLRGAEVILLRAKSSVTPRYVMRQELFESTHELATLLEKYIPESDVLFHVAAVSDFKPRRISGKISSKGSFRIDWIAQKKLINDVKNRNPKIKLIGFKAVSGSKQIHEKATEKLNDSGADAVVANDISRSDRGFGVDENEVTVVVRSGESFTIPLQSKNKIAEIIVTRLIGTQILS